LKLGLWLLAAATLPGQSLIIKDAVVIDATGARPRRASVAINRGRIVAIEKKIHARRGDEVVQAKGKFLIPGLWDMHIHLGPPEVFFPLLLANGITGVREMFTGIPMPVINAWRSRPDVPRIFAPGFLDGPPLVWSGPPPPGAIAVGTAEQARMAVRALAASRVDFLKVYTSIPREAYFAIAEEARALGIPFAGHVPEEVSAAEASDAGQRSQEHLIGILEACSTNEDALRRARVTMMLDQNISGEERMRELAFPNPKGLFNTYSDSKAAALFEKFVKNGTWQTPTLALLSGFARMRDAGFLDDPRRKYLLRAWREQWDPSRNFFLHDLSAADLDALNARIHALLDRYEKLVGDMHRAGVEFLAGTDANGVNPVYPGFGLHDELALLVKSGLSNLEALQAATRNASRYFGNPDFGTIEVNQSADLVLLDADPLLDIRNTEKIEAVVLRGRYYSRENLDAMLKRVEQIAAR
jgi:imidazolonepropionase-like amidohydrolase